MDFARPTVDRKEVEGGLMPVEGSGYSDPVGQRLSPLPTKSAPVDGGLIPASAANRYSGIVRPPQSRISYQPVPTGPTPPELQGGQWAAPPYAHEQTAYQGAYQMGPYEAAGQPMASQPVGYSELAGVQHNVYEADASQSPPGVSAVPAGGMYAPPVERGASDTPRPGHVQSVAQGGHSVNF
jgi:hypothetical protein